jgi:hypothetical protein
MPDPLLLYSTNTWLAYAISQRYYNGSHFVWCSPFKGPGSTPLYANATPPSSSPLEIYRSLSADVNAVDQHSSKIAANKVGLLKGATIKRDQGKIDENTFNEITAVIDSSSKRDFRPLLYVIPYSLVANVILRVPVEQRAHPLSDEFIVEDLRSDLFDVLEFPI